MHKIVKITAIIKRNESTIKVVVSEFFTNSCIISLERLVDIPRPAKKVKLKVISLADRSKIDFRRSSSSSIRDFVISHRSFKISGSVVPSAAAKIVFKRLVIISLNKASRALYSTNLKDSIEGSAKKSQLKELFHDKYESLDETLNNLSRLLDIL